ncbi:UNVERIFIED_CONTAM: hypothetical protein NCL1_48180 [Trichonephila clavipes]
MDNGYTLMDKNISTSRKSSQNERTFYILTLPHVHSNSWDVRLTVPNDTRYARLEINLGIGQSKKE